VTVSGSELIVTLRRPRANWMPAVAGPLAWLAAVIHLVLGPEHFQERIVYGAFSSPRRRSNFSSGGFSCSAPARVCIAPAL